MALRSIGLRAEMKKFGKLGILPIFGGIRIADKDAGILMARRTTCLCLSASYADEQYENKKPHPLHFRVLQVPVSVLGRRLKLDSIDAVNHLPLPSENGCSLRKRQDAIAAGKRVNERIASVPGKLVDAVWCIAPGRSTNT